MNMINKTSDELTKKEKIIYTLIKIGIISWVSLTIIAMTTITLGITF